MNEAFQKIKNSNSILFNTIKNSYNNKKMSHAYLLINQEHGDIKEVVDFLIQTIISRDPFNGDVRKISSYADIEFIEEDKGVIKKDSIVNALTKLSETSLEDGAPKILIINNFENTNKYSANALLKFLEEPTENTFLILTTTNEYGVLSTIKSRCQMLYVQTQKIEQIEKEMLLLNIPEFNSKILANIFHNKLHAIEASTEDNYKIINLTINEIKEAMDTKHINIFKTSQLITKKNFNIVLGVITIFIKDVIKFSQSLPTIMNMNSYYKKVLKIDFDFQNAIYCINDFLISQERSVNFDLYKNKLILTLKGCLHE